jgi:hypothetical protein
MTPDESIEILRRKLTSGRKRSRLQVEIDLDPIPGWGNDPEDHRALVQRLLNDAVSHYNPTVTIEETP